jgi:ParB family transcriptional regulator, chromosome partitioning protein
MHLERIRCTDIRPDPRSGRTTLPDFDALADSIRMHGVLRPVLLRATAEGYVIVHGERRWRAAQMAGLETIPATIVDDFPETVSPSVDCAVQQAA